MTPSYIIESERYNFAGFQFPRYVYQLPKGSFAKRIAEAKKTKLVSGYYSSPGTAPASESSFYMESDFAPSLRIEYADKVVRSIAHKGWYSDEFQDQTIRGIVARLPRKRGFLAGWSMGEGMISNLDRSYIYDTAEDAALAADSMAERAAEREREFQAEENERMRIEDEEATNDSEVM